jgi:hypothetical protein
MAPCGGGSRTLAVGRDRTPCTQHRNRENEEAAACSVDFSELAASLIDWQEFQGMGQDWEYWVSRVFDRLDADHNGYVDLQEIMQCVVLLNPHTSAGCHRSDPQVIACGAGVRQRSAARRGFAHRRALTQRIPAPHGHRLRSLWPAWLRDLPRRHFLFRLLWRRHVGRRQHKLPHQRRHVTARRGEHLALVMPAAPCMHSSRGITSLMILQASLLTARLCARSYVPLYEAGSPLGEGRTGNGDGSRALRTMATGMMRQARIPPPPLLPRPPPCLRNAHRSLSCVRYLMCPGPPPRITRTAQRPLRHASRCSAAGRSSAAKADVFWAVQHEFVFHLFRVVCVRAQVWAVTCVILI